MKSLTQFLEAHNFLIKGHTKKQYKNPIISKLKLTEEQKDTIEHLESIFFSDKRNNSFDGELKYFKTDIVCMFFIVAACLVLDNSFEHYVELGWTSYNKYGKHNPYDCILSTFEDEDSKGVTVLDYITRLCKKSVENENILKTFCDIYKTNKSTLKEPDDIYNLFFEE